LACGRRFTTMEEAILVVVKRSGVKESFHRSKIETGVRRACQGRPVDDDALAALAQSVEETIRAQGIHEISSHDVGLAVLGPLRDLDEVAYLRFASVYKNFESLADFEREIKSLAPITKAFELRETVPSPTSAKTTQHRTVMQLNASGSSSNDIGKDGGR
jgi:transcriptional repressor NrdR